MLTKTLEPFSKQLTIIIGLVVVGLMTFGLSLSFYRNVLFEDTLRSMAVSNDKLRSDIAESQRDLEYFQSGQFKDKYAKENLGKINVGEKVLIMSDSSELQPLPGEEVISDAERKAIQYEEVLRQMPVPDHWVLYLFKQDELEEIKKRL